MQTYIFKRLFLLTLFKNTCVTMNVSRFIGFLCPRKGYEKCFVLIAEKKIPMASLSVVVAECHSVLPLHLHLQLKQLL